MRLNPVTWLIVLAAGLSLAADVILWAWVGRVVIPLLPHEAGGLSLTEWLRIAGPQLAWLTKATADALAMLALAAWIEALSRIHGRLRARRIALVER